MSRVIRAAVFQTAWTGDKESMIQVHEQAARDAAAQGAHVLCFQELFYGPYFCQVQDPAFYEYAERIPDGPVVERFRCLARELNLVLVLPMYEEEQPGVLYNTAAVIDADGSYLGKYRKTHIPQVKGFWEKFYFRPGNSGWPVFDTQVSRIGVYICYDRHFPEGWRALGLAGAEVVFNPSATSGGCPATSGSWNSERRPSPTSTSSAPSTGWASRSTATTTSTAPATSSTRRPVSWARSLYDKEPELVVRDLDLSKLREVRDRWQFYRDRTPEPTAPSQRPERQRPEGARGCIDMR